MNSITQDMQYKQSLMRYTEKYGVSRASRKYNRSRSYIYFWKARYDGTLESLACQSKRPHSHPKQHTEAELKLIQDMRRRDPGLGMVELWHRLRKKGYTRCLASLCYNMFGERHGSLPCLFPSCRLSCYNEGATGLTSASKDYPRPSESQSAVLSFAAFVLCRWNLRSAGAFASSNR